MGGLEHFLFVFVALVQCTECYNRCGNFPYDPFQRQGCCIDRLRNPIIYDRDLSLCCGGRLITKEDSDQQCCGNTAYYPNQDICCLGVLHSRLHNNRLAYSHCCGNLTYDVSKKHCCQDNLDPSRFSLTVREPGQFYKCCEDMTSLTIAELCPETESWCNGVRYNPTQHQCCADTLIGPEFECCNNQIMSSDQICCRYRGPRNKTSWDQNSCCETDESAVLFNSANKMCSRGHVVNKKMCGNLAYDPEDDLCCDGVKRYNRNGRKACCGRHLYNPHEECCAASYEDNQMRWVVARRNPQPPTQSCEGDDCDDVIDQRVCCYNKILRKDILQRGDNCCGSTGYYARYSTCCGGRHVIGKQEGCCDGVPCAGVRRKEKVKCPSFVKAKEHPPMFWARMACRFNQVFTGTVGLVNVTSSSEQILLTLEDVRSVTTESTPSVVPILVPAKCHQQVNKIQRKSSKSTLIFFVSSEIGEEPLVLSHRDKITRYSKRLTRLLYKHNC